MFFPKYDSFDTLNELRKNCRVICTLFKGNKYVHPMSLSIVFLFPMKFFFPPWGLMINFTNFYQKDLP